MEEPEKTPKLFKSTRFQPILSDHRLPRNRAYGHDLRMFNDARNIMSIRSFNP